MFLKGISHQVIHMRTLILALFGVSFLFVSCKDDIGIDTSSSAATDPFADITYLNSSFYTTNYNTSYNSGPQIFLYRVSGDGKVLENKFDLGMNGQGYFAITTDGTNLYLQSRTFNSVMKCSPVGEVLQHRWLIRNSPWQSCGISYDSTADSLCVLTRNLDNPKYYELLYVDKTNPGTWHVKASAIINELSAEIGVYAMKFQGTDLYLLGQDTTLTDVFVKTNLALNTFEFTRLNTDSTTGFCFKDGNPFFAFQNREIKQSQF
jgi:hypothetical protein